jgi:alpha-tubulin suppressor-like RCC1 family protein
MRKILVFIGITALVSLVVTAPAGATGNSERADTGPDKALSAPYRTISTGRNHTCALQGNGTAWCWGDNTYGQLGDGTGFSSSLPVAVALPGVWRVISAGAYVTCGIQATGKAYCWGANFVGQLGDGTSLNSPVPVPVFGSALWATISAGGWELKGHSCGVKIDGTAWCWGYGSYGQLGDGTTGSSPIPVQEAMMIPKWRTITAGAFHSCGILTNGTAWCWGANYLGQLGSGSTVNSAVPTPVSNPGPWTAISAGGVTVDLSHTCAIAASGRAWCWGSGSHGQLGNGSPANQLNPALVVGGGSWRSIGAGGLHSCGTRLGGGLRCWGNNAQGQLGNGSLVGSLIPVLAAGGWSWVMADAGGQHSGGIRTGPTAWCWGDNAFGQLGIGSVSPSLVPALV